MNNMLLCSTGTFIGEWNGYDHTIIEKIKPELYCQGFELLMYSRFAKSSGEYAAVDTAIMVAKENGVVFHAMHMTKVIGELISRNEDGDIEAAIELFESNCKYASKYGIKILVLHLWGGPSSDRSIEVNIGMFSILKEISDRYGMILTVENIVCNTHKPLMHMKKLWELYGNDVNFTIDTRQAEFHKSIKETCESDFLWKNGLVRHIHIADFNGGEMDWPKLRHNTNLGEGNVDFTYFFEHLKSVGFDGSITLEIGMIPNIISAVRDICDALEFIRFKMLEV